MASRGADELLSQIIMCTASDDLKIVGKFLALGYKITKLSPVHAVFGADGSRAWVLLERPDDKAEPPSEKKE